MFVWGEKSAIEFKYFENILSLRKQFPCFSLPPDTVLEKTAIWRFRYFCSFSQGFVSAVLWCPRILQESGNKCWQLKQMSSAML